MAEIQLAQLNIPSNFSNVWNHGAYPIIPMQTVGIHCQQDIKIEENVFDEETIKWEEPSQLKKTFICSRCNTIFFSQLELEQHYEFHPTHNKSYQHESYVSSKLRMHTNKRLNTVTNVNKSIIRKLRHEPSSMNNEILQNKSTMVRMNSDNIDLEQKKLRTEIPNSESNSESYLTNRLNNIHSDNSQFECFQCKFISKNFSEIAYHIAVHNKDKLINDNFLSQKENDSDKIEKDDTLVKKYSCNDCNFLTYEMDEFKFHLKTHRNRIPHQCEECEAIFIDLQLMMCSSVQRPKRQKNQEKLISINNDKSFLNSFIKKIKLAEVYDKKYDKSPIVILEREQYALSS